MTLPIMTMQGKRPLPVRVTTFSESFWQSLTEGEFITSRCDQCQHLTFPPKSICPVCHARAISWAPLSGRGKLYSYTTVHAAPLMFAADLPFKVAIVDLLEGVRLVTRLLDEDESIAIDADVQLVVTQYDDGYLFAATAANKTQ